MPIEVTLFFTIVSLIIGVRAIVGIVGCIFAKEREPIHAVGVLLWWVLVLVLGVVTAICAHYSKLMVLEDAICL